MSKTLEPTQVPALSPANGDAAELARARSASLAHSIRHPLARGPSCAATCAGATGCARWRSPPRYEVSRGPVREALLNWSRRAWCCCAAIAARWSRGCRARTWRRFTACGWRSNGWRSRTPSRHGTEADFAELDVRVARVPRHRLRPAADRARSRRPGRRFHDAVYRAAHHDRLYAAWSAIRSQVYVLLLGRNVAGPDFREDTYVGHLELDLILYPRRATTAASSTGHRAAPGGQSYLARAGQLTPIARTHGAPSTPPTGRGSPGRSSRFGTTAASSGGL